MFVLVLSKKVIILIHDGFFFVCFLRFTGKILLDKNNQSMQMFKNHFTKVTEQTD